MPHEHQDLSKETLFFRGTLPGPYGFCKVRSEGPLTSKLLLIVKMLPVSLIAYFIADPVNSLFYKEIIPPLKQKKK